MNIKEFLQTAEFSGSGSGSGSGYGYGDGDGYGYDDDDGYGYGDGYGDGDGYGYGSDDGSGDGSGSGYNYGDGIKSFCGDMVYYVDGIPTIIKSIKNKIVAKGFIVKKDLILKPCYIAKVGNYFAHGDTIHQAFEDAIEKEMQNKSIEDRITEFLLNFKYGKKYPAMDFYRWHTILTGSCRLGKNTFCEENNVDLKNGMYTVDEFIEMTENNYNGEIIKQLKKGVSNE